MAAPNIVNVTSITAKTNVANVTTVATAIVSNAAASNQVYKINSLYISNVNGTNTADVTIDLFRSSTAYRLGYTLAVPNDTTLDFLSKGIYLEEGDSLRLTASANNYIEAVCGYEVIS